MRCFHYSQKNPSHTGRKTAGENEESRYTESSDDCMDMNFGIPQTPKSNAGRDRASTRP
jgi:hypothetical protein